MLAPYVRALRSPTSTDSGTHQVLSTMEFLCRLDASAAWIKLQEDAPIPRSYAAHPRPWSRTARPHRNRHSLVVRSADALRSRRRIPAADDEEAPSEIDHRRATVVPERR